MYDDKVFGPLNFNQFIRVAICIGAILYAYNFMSTQNSILVIVVAAAILISVFINREEFVLDEEYLKKKRNHCKNLGEFQRYVSRKIAEIVAQVEIRKAKGMDVDPSFYEKIKMLESALRDTK